MELVIFMSQVIVVSEAWHLKFLFLYLPPQPPLPTIGGLMSPLGFAFRSIQDASGSLQTGISVCKPE